MFGMYTSLAGLVFGVPALLLFLMTAFTEHTVTHWNENLLLLNPLTTLAAPLGVALARGSARALRWSRYSWYALSTTTLLALVLKVLPAFDQANLEILVLAIPLNAGFAVGFSYRNEGSGD